MKIINFKKNSTLFAALIYILSSFLVQGLTFLTLPIFTKLMSPSDFGLFGIYSIWINLTTIIIGMQIYGTVNNAFLDYSEKNIYLYCKKVSILPLLALLICLFFTYIFQDILTDIFQISFPILVLGLLQSYFVCFFNLLLAIFRVKNKAISFFTISFLHSVATIGFSVVAILLQNRERYLVRILVTAIISIISGILCHLYIYYKGRGQIEKNANYIKYALTIAIPLIFHGIAGIIMSRLDQMMLLKMIGSSEAGIYNFATNFGTIIYVIFTACNQAFVPWYYKKMRTNPSSLIVSELKNYIKLGEILAIGVNCILPQLVYVMGDEAYYSAVNFAPLFLIAQFLNFLYTFPANFEFYHKKTCFIAIGTILSAVLNIVGNAILIPQFGSTGAAYATCLSYLFLLIFHYILASKLIGKYELNLGIFALSIIRVIGCFFIMRCVDGILYRGGLFAIILVSYLLNNKLRKDKR